MHLITKLAVAALAVLAVTPPAASAATRNYEGTVVSVNRVDSTFRLSDSERGTVRVKVVSSTSFQRIGGFSGLRAGLTNVEVIVKRSSGSWVAVRVERSGGGGSHGGHGGRGGHG
jgi:uncharacterized membrane protein YgcG